MKQLASLFAIVFLLNGTLSAQAPGGTAPDLAGRWTGAADTTDYAGTKRMETQTLEIKMVDGKVTGTRLNKKGTGGSSVAVQQVGNKINLYEFLTPNGGEHLRWKFELKEGKLVGTFSAQHDNPNQWQYDRIGAMTLSKVETPPAPPVPDAPAK